MPPLGREGFWLVCKGNGASPHVPHVQPVVDNAPAHKTRTPAGNGMPKEIREGEEPRRGVELLPTLPSQRERCRACPPASILTKTYVSQGGN